jgi:hypothetical protein
MMSPIVQQMLAVAAQNAADAEAIAHLDFEPNLG